jgi:histidine kinase
MFIALAASLVLSTLIALVMSRRTLLSLDQLRVGARGLAAGNYDERVARPAEPELADLADDINHLAASLAQTEQRRAALIGDVAHEMRTPLTTMNGVLEGFDDGLFTAAELADAVRTEVARLHHLAGDLAAVSRAEEGRLQLDRQAGDLREVITSVAERLRPRFDTAGIGLTVEAPTALPATFDHERMVQVLTNLIGNALAYTPGGGTVTVNAHATAGEVRIAVTDTGRGLLPQDLERIFERFYRADPHDHSGGTGIGLTISRAIARAHGGRLTATSPGPGRGATFELVVPTG